MTGKEEEYRASAIRALCSILDVSVSLPSLPPSLPSPLYTYINHSLSPAALYDAVH